MTEPSPSRFVFVWPQYIVIKEDVNEAMRLMEMSKQSLYEEQQATM